MRSVRFAGQDLRGHALGVHLVPSFILPELNIHLKMFKMKILKLNLIHSVSIFSVILVPNLWLGACCRCRARVCRCFCLSPQLFARKVSPQKIRRTKNDFIVQRKFTMNLARQKRHAKICTKI